MITRKYGSGAAAKKAFPIDRLWLELKNVINSQEFDTLSTTTKANLLADYDTLKKIADRSTYPRYDLFEIIRKEANREMFYPLGASSEMLKKWNASAKHVLIACNLIEA